MPRRKTNARPEHRIKPIKLLGSVRIVAPSFKDKDVYPGWIVAVAEWKEAEI